MLTKNLIFVLITHCLLIVAGNHQTLNELSAKCRKENNLKEGEVAHLNETRHVETNDEKVKCFIKCILTGLRLMNDEGDLTLNGAPERKMKYRKHFPACRNVTGTNSCDKALNFQNCVWKQIDAEEKNAQ